MMRIKTIITVALNFFSATVFAQGTYTDKDDNRYEFHKHAFLNVMGGVQYTLGEAKFGDLLSPNVQLGLGYQFSSVVAARLQANARQSKGGWNGYAAGNELPHTQTYKWKYVAPGLDLMFNLTNLIGGYHPFRLLNITAFIGGGANFAWGNSEANDMAKNLPAGYELEYLWDDSKIRPFGRGGLEFAFRMGDAVSFIIEGNANILNDRYNSKKANNSDWYFNALAGFRINLGRTYDKIVPPAPVDMPEPVEVAEVIELEPAIEPVTVTEVAVVEKVEPIRRDIFFAINKFDIRGTEAQKVSDIADYLKQYPEAKVVVTGYADAGTGNDTINDRLAAQRADAVVKMLREQYDIPVSRITYDSKGSRVQPFAENDMNRVSICIAE